MSPQQSAGGYRVSGRVQGVGFRYWVVGQAGRLGLSGYVRNTREGTVEVFAAGSEGALNSLAEALRDGPAGARVSSVDSLPVPDDPLPFPFEIRR